MHMNMDKFLNDIVQIMEPTKFNKNTMKDFYRSLKDVEGGEIVIDTVDTVAAVHNLRQKLQGFKYSDEGKCEYITIDEDEVVHIKGDNYKPCRSEETEYVQMYFREIVNKSDLEKVSKAFVWLESETEAGFVKYKICLIDRSEEKTLKSLKQCIQLVRGSQKVTFTECVECCSSLIQMLPISRLDERWRDCSQIICTMFKNIYDERGRYNNDAGIDELLGICGAKICDVEYWEFLSMVYSAGDEKEIKKFWKLMQKQLKKLFKKQFDIPCRLVSSEKEMDLRAFIYDQKNK